MSPRILMQLTGTAFRRWMVTDSDQLAASIAFYAVLSMAPMLLLAVGAVSELFGTSSAPAYLLRALQTVLGPNASLQGERLVRMILDARGSGTATVTGLVMFVVFGSTVIRQIRHALARIWGVPPRSFRRLLLERVVSYGLVPVVVIGAMVTVALSLAVSVAGPIVVMMLPRGGELWGVLHTALSFGLLTVLIAAVFRFGPGVRIRWSDVWGGAALTAALFTLGNILIGMMIARSLLVPLYGTAGAVIVVLLWDYYAAQMLLFGAQFTRAYAERCGSWRERAHTTLQGPAAEARPLPHIEPESPLLR